MNSKPKLNTYTPSTDKAKLLKFNTLLKDYIESNSTRAPPFSKLDLINIKNYLTDFNLELNSFTKQIDEDTKRFNKFIRKRQRGNEDNLSDSSSSSTSSDEGENEQNLQREEDLNKNVGDEDDNDDFKPSFEDKKSKRLRTSTTNTSILIKTDEDLLKPPVPIVKEETPERELRSRLRSRSSRNTPLLEPELLPQSIKEKVKASPRRNNKSKPSKILSDKNTPNSEVSNTEVIETSRSPLPPKAPKISLEAIKTKIDEVIQLRPLPPKPEGVKCKSKIADNLLEIEEDFTKQNNTNQAPITTFYNWLDPYLKNIAEDDLKVLQTESDIEPYLVVPPIGKNYKERWNEKDRKLSIASKDSSSIAPDQPSTSLAGPFSTRLFAALLQEQIDIPPPPEDDTEDEGSEQPQTQVIQSQEPFFDNEFEKRVRRELLFLGLIQEEDLENPVQTDESPVVIELKRLQNQLKEQSRINQARKHKLLQIAQEHIAYQEYKAILDELDKTVEQCYVKRLKSLKAKKKKSTALRPLSDSTLAALDRRQRFVAALSPLFNKESYDLPKESIYKDIVTDTNSNDNNTYN